MEHVVQGNEVDFDLIIEELSKDLKELKNKFPTYCRIEIFICVSSYKAVSEYKGTY